MEKNQSEQQFYLSNLGSPSIISPAQFPCTVIGSNKNIIHTVPNSNSSLNFNTKYSNASNDFKIAQNLPNSNIHNCYSTITNSSDELKFMLANSKAKKPYIKRNLNMKTPSQCLNSNDNSSDITAAPNQLTILVQEVLPAQVPDNPILTTSAIAPHINSTHLSIKAHSSNIISTSKLNEKIDLSNKKDISISEKKEKSIFCPISKDLESVRVAVPVAPTTGIGLVESRDTISEVIKEVLMKALSNDPHEDVFLSVIKSRENVTRPFMENPDGLDISSSMSSPILAQPSDSSCLVGQSSLALSLSSTQTNNIPHQRHPDPSLSGHQQQCRPNKTISTANFIRPQFLNQPDIKPVANDIIAKSTGIAQSFPKSDFYSTNCQIQQKPNLAAADNGSLHHHHASSEIGSKPNKRRNSTVPKSSNKKQKLSDSVFHDKLNIPMQRYQQIMVKQLGTPNFRKLVHEPRIKNNLTVLAPLGCKQRPVQCSDVGQLQDNCVKYKRVPFTMPQINPIHLASNRSSSENSFILQNINASIPEGILLSTHESDDIDCLIAPSPSNNELDYLSVFNCDPISSPSVSLSGPNLEMLHPPNRTQSPQLSVFHCPNKDYLKFDHSDLSLLSTGLSLASTAIPTSGTIASSSSSSSRKSDCQSVLRATGISRVQISHKYSAVPASEPIAENALIDSETGEVVNKPTVTEQIRAAAGKSREKLLMTFTINPPDDVEKTVRNITDVLGIDYSSVEFKETTRGGEIAIDKDSIVSNTIPKEICERYNTSVVVNNASYKLEPSVVSRTFDNLISVDKAAEMTMPLYSEKVYKSTALLNRAALKCSNCDKPISSSHNNNNNNNVLLCDRLKYRDLSFCDETCQQEYCSLADDDNLSGIHTNNNNNSTNNTTTNNRDQCIFIGEDLCDASVIVQGSISKSKQISKRLGALINDKLLKKKAAATTTTTTSALVPFVKLSPKVHKGSKYHVFHHSTTSNSSSSPVQELFTTNSPPAQSQSSLSVVISDSHFQKLAIESRTVLRPESLVDRRACSLCQRPGDQSETGTGRLLCFDVDKWLHINCALWCNNVFEMQCGALNNVADSFEMSLRSVCTSCAKPGAGIACYYPRCTGKYHVPCALDRGCLFFADRAMYCPLHQQSRDLGPHLSTLSVDRRVYISRDELSQVAGIVNNEDRSFFLRIGSLIVISIGQLLPHQIHSGHFHNLNHVYPCGFKSRRIHWSSRIVNSRSLYECEILTSTDNEQPLFKVTATDENLDDECYFGATCSESWRKILKKIANLRQSHQVVKFFPEHIKAEDLYGLTEPHVLRAIESLPGLETLNDYAFKFGKMQLIGEMPLPVNVSGSIRTEPFVKLYRHFHKPAIHQSPTSARQLMSASSSSSGTTTSTTSAMTATKPFDSSLLLLLHGNGNSSNNNSTNNHTSNSNKINLSSKWQQYRKLKSETKLNVVLKRSKIQGFGLYAARDIEKGTMIIEYVGELIRNEVANIREKQYESKKQGIYMFRLDPSTVIDATRAGDLARYINHCCDPNCVTELLEFEKESHIVIISSRKIEKSEELTYDYKFDLDDGKDDKIPCMCGARNCRRWMN